MDEDTDSDDDYNNMDNVGVSGKTALNVDGVDEYDQDPYSYNSRQQ